MSLITWDEVDGFVGESYSGHTKFKNRCVCPFMHN